MEFKAEKGIVTLATGEKYVKCAVNLLKSYRLNQKEPLPFCLITDKEYKYNELFDDVVFIKNCKYNTLDKIEIVEHSPYKENLFIESDILVYGDISHFFDYFKGATTFSAFGRVCDLDGAGAWFTEEGVKAYTDKVTYSVIFHGGIYYINNEGGETLNNLYKTAMDVIKNNDIISFRGWLNGKEGFGEVKPNDETILSLSMALNNCKPIFPNGEEYTCSSKYICLYPFCLRYNGKKFKCNIKKQILEYDLYGEWVKNVPLLHFGNIYTKTFDYQREIYRLDKATYRTNSKSFISLTLLFIYEKVRGLASFLKHRILRIS